MSLLLPLPGRWIDGTHKAGAVGDGEVSWTVKPAAGPELGQLQGTESFPSLAYGVAGGRSAVLGPEMRGDGFALRWDQGIWKC
jgi:hypothetical protein